MKYGNRKVLVDGITFDSQAEARRYGQLMILQRAGRISGLTRQVAFELARGVKLHGEKRARPPVRYVADFVYSDPTQPGIIIEDVKGMDTPLSRLKRHLMKTVHGLDVRVVR